MASTNVEELAEIQEVRMSRVQLALNVRDVDEAVAFYSALLGVQPHKRKPGYANFVSADPPLKLVLLENAGAEPGSLNHLGVEHDSSEAVHAEIARLRQTGLVPAEEMGTTCCYAEQDKAWVHGPGGEAWEVYTVLADAEQLGRSEVAGPLDNCCATTPEGVQVCC